MSFVLPDQWVWDFWTADDGDQFHLYYLHAPRTLGDPGLRHRNARIGHATSPDLTRWTDHGTVLGPGESGDFDAGATWTGSVVPGPDGDWKMFYTGAQFIHPEAFTNIESIGVATSGDLHGWTKSAGPVVRADPRWYETLDQGTWKEEACRDPWVHPSPAGDGWHMLYTARARSGDLNDRGVVGHATSPDLETWTARPPLSRPGAGFMHLEVPQLATVEGKDVLLFSCPTDHLARSRRERGETGGVWAAPAEDDGTFAVEDAYLLLDQKHHYSGRAVQGRDGRWIMLAFNHVEDEAGFVGGVCDPLPLVWSREGRLTIDKEPSSS